MSIRALSISLQGSRHYSRPTARGGRMAEVDSGGPKEQGTGLEK